MKVNLRQDELASILRLAEFYIENFHGLYNEKRAALLLRNKLKRYGKNVTLTTESEVVRDDRERGEN